MASPGAPPIAVSQGHFVAGASATERDGEKTPPPMLNDAQSRQNTFPLVQKLQVVRIREILTAQPQPI